MKWGILKKNLLLLLLPLLLLPYLASGSPHLLQDPTNDLVNIWTGEKAEAYVGFVDVVKVEYYSNETYAIFRITLSDNLPAEGTVFFYLVFETDGQPENNYPSLPLNGTDTMYGLKYVSYNLTITRSTYQSGGWIETGTEAQAKLESLQAVAVYIPLYELGGEIATPKWKLVTEYSSAEISGVGDYVPDSGLVELYPPTPPPPPKPQTGTLVIGVPEYVSVVYIDGEAYEPSNGVVEANLTYGEHFVSVPEGINLSDDAMAAFSGWSDGERNAGRWVNISDEGVRLNAEYIIQYLVIVSSPLGEAGESGWYPQGANVFIYVKPIVIENRTIRYTFKKWSGSWGGNSLDPNSPSQIVNDLQGPINVVAEWQVEYYLKIISRYDDPQGEGWYKAFTEADVSIKKEAEFKNGTKAVFAGWSGDVTSEQTELKVYMDKPIVLRASWRVYYKVTFEFVDDDGEPVNPQSSIIADLIAGKSLPCKPAQCQCTFWLEAGSYEVTSAIYMGVDVSRGTRVTVTGPSTFKVPLSIYDVTVRVEDFLRRPLAGVEVVLTLPTGETLTAKTDGNGVAVLENVPQGHYKAETRGQAINSRKEFEVTSDVEVVLGGNVSWGEAALTGAAAVAAGSAAYFVLKRVPCPKKVKRKLEELVQKVGDSLGSLTKTLERLESVEKELRETIADLEKHKWSEEGLRDLLQCTIKSRDSYLRSLNETIRQAEARGDYKALATLYKARIRAEEIYEEKIARIREELERVEQARAKLEKKAAELEAEAKALEHELAAQLESLNSNRGQLLALLAKYMVCFDCDRIYKIYTDYLDRVARLEGLADSMRKDVEKRKEELASLKKRLADIENKREEYAAKLEDIAKDVKAVFHDMISENPPEYIVLCGVRIDLSKKGVQAFLNRYDSWRKQMRQLTRDYWRLRKEMENAEKEEAETKAEIKATEKALNLAERRLKALEAAIAALRALAKEIDKIYKRCALELRRCRDKLRETLHNAVSNLPPVTNEITLRDIKNKIRKARSRALKRLSRYEGLEGKVNAQTKRIKARISDVENAKKIPYPPSLRGKVEPHFEVFDEIIKDLEELIDKCEKLKKRAEKEKTKADNLARRCVNTLEKDITSFNDRVLELLGELEKAKCIDDCWKIERKFWREWNSLKAEASSLDVGSHRLERVETFDADLSEIAEELKALSKEIEEAKKRIKKKIATLKILQLLYEEEKEKLLDNIKEHIGDVEKFAEKGKEGMERLETSIEIAEKTLRKRGEALRRARRLPEKAGKILGKVATLAARAREIIELFKAPERAGDILEKMATIFSLGSTIFPYSKYVPGVGWFLDFYSTALGAFAKALNKLEAEIFKLRVTEREIVGVLDEALGDWDRVLRDEVQDQLQRLKDALKGASFNEKLINQAAREYLIRKLRRFDP